MSTPVESLIEMRESHSIRIDVLDEVRADQLVPIILHLGDRSWNLYIDDEYGDLRQNRQHMCLFLALRELSMYQEQADFLGWCNQNGCHPADEKLLAYYRGLSAIVNEIESIIGDIDCKISGLDYELRTGVIDELIKAG